MTARSVTGCPSTADGEQESRADSSSTPSCSASSSSLSSTASTRRIRLTAAVHPWPLFTSRDLLSCLCRFLSINDVLHCSALSSHLHSFFHSELVWAPRLARAKAVQSGPEEEAQLLPAAPQPPTFPPPLPLPEAIHHIAQYVAEQDGVVRGLVYEPSTGLYHVHWSSASPPEIGQQLVMILYGTMRLAWRQEDAAAWRQEAAHWEVMRHGDHQSGVLAVNVGNAHLLFQAAPEGSQRSSSSKAQYVSLQQCSEHSRRRCHRLLPPSALLPSPSPEPKEIARCIRDGLPIPQSPLPPFSPPPLCSECRQAIAGQLLSWCDGWFHCGPQSGRRRWQVRCVVRINRDEFDAAIGIGADAAFSCRFLVLHDHGAYSCQRQCTQSFGHYSVLTDSNVAWQDYAPPDASGRSIQRPEHLARCDRPLVHYAASPYVFLDREGNGEISRCRACLSWCEGEVYHCARCLYDLCAACASSLQLTAPAASAVHDD